MIDKYPFISIIVPTYKREQVLCETIRQLLVQDYPNFEVIIVDQTPKHEPKTEEFLIEQASRIVYRKWPFPSLPAARNLGAKIAQGEIVLYVDDDVRVQPDLIRQHARNFVDAGVGGVTGPVLEAGLKKSDSADSRRITRWGRVIANNASTIRTQVEWASGCNVSFRRELIERAGWFDLAFQGNAIFEDTDFSFRLRRLGYDIVYDPEAVVFHIAAEKGGCQSRVKARSNYHYWFIRNKTLFFLKNIPHRYIPLLTIVNLSRAAKVGLLDYRDPGSFLYLLRAAFDGTNSYLQGPITEQVIPEQMQNEAISGPPSG